MPEHPYVQENHLTGYALPGGGKINHLGKATQRWSDFDFEGLPVTDSQLTGRYVQRHRSMYSYVEKFVGISGNKDGLATLPDGEFFTGMGTDLCRKLFQRFSCKEL